MSYINTNQNLEIPINVFDISNEFVEYWKFAIKKQLKNHSVIITNKNKVMQLSLLNLSLLENKKYINDEFCIININILKINNEKDIEGNNYSTFKNIINNNDINIIFIEVKKGEENTLRTCTKIFNQIKKNLYRNNNQINLLFIPKYNIITGLIYSKIESFLQFFSSKLNIEINNKFSFYDKYFSDNSIETVLNSENNTYQYITYKKEYIINLLIFNLWNELQITCSNDLFCSFPNLNKNRYIYNEPFPLNDFKIYLIKTKLQKKTMTNLDYQQFLIYHYIKACKFLQRYDLLHTFISDLPTHLSLYISYFDSMFHYYSWIYILLDRILQYIQTISPSNNETTSINKKTLISIQTKVYLTMKKILRQFALLTKIEIPNEHIFRLAISYNDYKEISNEITKALESVNEEMEDNKIYQQFIIEISDIFHDNNIHLVFINQKSFLEEYLSLLININKIYVELNYIHQSINILFESLPIFFALNNFDEVKKILIYLSKRKEIQQHKWIYIQDLIQIMIILLMNCLNKTFLNLTILLQYIDKPFNNEQMINCFIFNNDNIDIKNLPHTILTSFIENFNDNNILPSQLNSNQMNTFNLNKIIKISFEKTLLFCRNDNSLKFKIYITNNSSFYFKIHNIILKVIEKNSFKKETTNFILIEGNIENDNIICLNKSINNECMEIKLINIQNKIKPNTTFQIKEILFKHRNNIYGSYSLEMLSEEIGVQYNCFDIECYTRISCYLNEEINIKQENTFYYNFILSLDILFSNNIHEINDEFLLEIKIEPENPNNQIHIIQNVMMNHSNDITSINTFRILFCNIKQVTKNNLLKIPFVIENTIYNNLSKNEEIKITISYINNNQNYLHSFVQFHHIKLKHIVAMDMHCNFLNEEIILIQIEFEALIKNQILLYHNHECRVNNQNEKEILSKYFYVLSFKKDNQNILNKILCNFVKCSVFECEYLMCYPLNNILNIIEHNSKLKKYQLEIKIEEKKTELYVMDEIKFQLILRNNTLYKQKILVDIKENSSWIIVNKVKFISYIKEKSESLSVISLIPLCDGYINFPEIELYEYQSSQDNLPLKINNQNIHITMNFNIIRIQSKDKKLVKTAII